MYTRQVSRYTPAGYVVSRVFAQDADFANNARLSFHIVSGDGRPSVDGLFDVDPDLGAVSVAGDLQRADRDRYDVLLAVTDGGVPAQSAVVTLTINLVSTAWSEPHASSKLEADSDDGSTTVADVFRQYRLILVVLAVVTVFLTILLVLAIVCVKYRQVILSHSVTLCLFNRKLRFRDSLFCYTAPGRGTGYCFRAISLFLCLFLCQQQYEKTVGPICMKFSGKVCSDHGTS